MIEKVLKVNRNKTYLKRLAILKLEEVILLLFRRKELSAVLKIT